MLIDNLVFEGRTPVSVQFMALRDRYGELEGAIRGVEAKRDHAGREAARLSAELADLERRRSGGEDVAAKAAKTEKALHAARAEAGGAWAERIVGAERAAKDAAGALARFASANYPALARELAEDAAAVKDRADATLEAINDAHREREAVAGRVNALSSLVGVPPKPGLRTPESRLGRLARDARRLLGEGGEAAPVPPHEPATEEAIA